MPLRASADLSTGSTHTSLVAQSGDVRMVFTAAHRPLFLDEAAQRPLSPAIPSFSAEAWQDFVTTHGTGVRAVGLEVEDVGAAFAALVRGGLAPVLPPTPLAGPSGGDGVVMAEVELYGDVVLRVVSTAGQEPDGFLPGFAPASEGRAAPMEQGEESIAAFAAGRTYGIRRIDHVVGNVWDMDKASDGIRRATGFHMFAHFTGEEVGTANSGLNSLVLASDSEGVLLPINEPTYGTKRKSQIQTYLEHNRGEGVQHIALLTDDIFATVEAIRRASHLNGLRLLPPPPHTYYADLPRRMGSALTPEQCARCEELGILADMDDEGVLLQIFTEPAVDRPTLFCEIIQRIGCDVGDGQQRPGCGGFGVGNFAALFKAIEDYERERSL